LAIINSVSEIGVTGNIATLLDDLRYLRPTYTIAVPRVLEKIFNAASHKAGGGLKGQIFRRAVQSAIEFSKALDSEAGASKGLARKRKIFDRLVYGQIRAVLGGRMEYMVSGGAPLSPMISHFFRGAGINVLEGYGLTETSGTTFVNRATANTIGSLGYPMAGMEYKIDSKSQLWIKYPSLLKCYHNDPKQTHQVLKSGWFNTGDLVIQNPDGSVSLTGRSKDLIITAGGKNVSPVILESRLKDNGLISNAVLVGDRKPYISCLITLDEEFFERWKKSNGIKNLPYRKDKDDIALCAEIQRYVDQANLLVSRAESIRRFAILDEDFSEANGLLTTSLKLRRQAVYDRYANLINSQLYDGEVK
jgi:long-chain acyl-CoA synthetase